MANATGTAHMARKNNKKCWIVLKGDKSSFDSVSTVIMADNHSGTWLYQVVNSRVVSLDAATDLFLIHAKCQNEPHTFKKKHKHTLPGFLTAPPETGTLTITLTGLPTGTTVEPVPVVYSDDATP